MPLFCVHVWKTVGSSFIHLLLSIIFYWCKSTSSEGRHVLDAWHFPKLKNRKWCETQPHTWPHERTAFTRVAKPHQSPLEVNPSLLISGRPQRGSPGCSQAPDQIYQIPEQAVLEFWRNLQGGNAVKQAGPNRVTHLSLQTWSLTLPPPFLEFSATSWS